METDIDKLAMAMNRLGISFLDAKNAIEKAINLYSNGTFIQQYYQGIRPGVKFIRYE